MMNMDKHQLAQMLLEAKDTATPLPVEYRQDFTLEEAYDVQRELTALSADDSASATARKLELEEQLAEKQKELADYQYEQNLAKQEEALDREAELAVAKGHVRIVRDGDTLTGNGALADFGSEYVKVIQSAQIETARLKGADLTKRGMF